MSELEIKHLKCDTCGGALQHINDNQYRCAACRGIRYVQNYSNKEIALIQQADICRTEHMRYDEAIEGYEAALRINPNNISAHWGMFLAEYGIEYVKDIDGLYKPTFHRLSRNSVLSNRNLLEAVDLSYGNEKNKYIADAELIEKLRVQALSIADKNEPFDIFICYKKTLVDNPNALTREAAWAQDYYNEFTAMGLKVFFADKSLAHAAISGYEPVIFNALHTAKFMLILASNEKHLNSAWVYNEWSRFLRRKKNDPSINFTVVYEHLEPYNLPRVLQACQALNHNKPSCYEDLKKQIASTVAQADSLKHKIKLNTVDIKGGEVAKRASLVQVNQIERVSLGTYTIGAVSVSDEQRIKEAKDALANGHFKFALEIIQDELLPAQKNNYEVLFLKLQAEKQTKSEELFYADIANFSDIQAIDTLLACSPKAFAEDFITKWIEALCRYSVVAPYINSLEYLVKFDVPSRGMLISEAKKFAIETLDTTLIKMVERCFDAQDVDLFIDFYFRIAQGLQNKNSNNSAAEYYNKVLAIDCGHTESLFALFTHKYFNQNTLNPEAHAEFEHICKYATIPQREQYLDRFIDKLIQQYSDIFIDTLRPYCENDKKLFEEEIDYYISLYRANSKNQKNALKRIYKKMQAYGFWGLAEKYCAIHITLDETNENLYFNLLQIKLHCFTDKGLAFVKQPKIRSTDEYRMAQKLASEHQNKALLNTLTALSTAQYENIEKGIAQDIQPEKNKRALTKEDGHHRIPYGTEIIKDYEFDSNTKITSIEIPNSVTTIGESAFQGCTSLTSITIPNSVTTIGKGAFYGCQNLTSITLPFTGNTLNGTNNALFGFIFRASIFNDYINESIPSSLKTVVITGGNSIGDFVFSNCRNLTSIEIPNSVTKIGNYAFKNCSDLTSITIPDSVTGIGEGAFIGWGKHQIIFVHKKNSKKWFYKDWYSWTKGCKAKIKYKK
ncbi:MAG: leucine-rich repeat protein [Firmicutes bacterium]|nr:leucine-rich repeat protein [Bacillota bacterium]